MDHVGGATRRTMSRSRATVLPRAKIARMAYKPSADRDRSLPPPFDLKTFLDSAGLTRRVIKFKRNAIVFAQGASADSVYYVQAGGVQLSVLSSTGREAVVAMLGPGDFFGEGCLAAQAFRMGSASAITPSAIL